MGWQTRAITRGRFNRNAGRTFRVGNLGNDRSAGEQGGREGGEAQWKIYFKIERLYLFSRVTRNFGCKYQSI